MNKPQALQAIKALRKANPTKVFKLFREEGIYTAPGRGIRAYSTYFIREI